MTHEEPLTNAQQAVELKRVRESVARILDDYEKTANTLDAVTEQVDGVDATDHASNVEALKQDLLTDLGDKSITPPWEREGYESKQTWLDAQE